MPIKTPKKQPISLKQGFVVLVIGLVLGWQFSHFTEEEPKTELMLFDSSDTEVEAALDLDLFWDVYSKVEGKYYDADTVTRTDLEYGAVRGLVDALGDPYSGFMDPDESEAFETSLNGELEGIGAELTVRDGKLVVVSPLKDSPAQEAGLLPADHIYLVDGEPTAEMTLWDAIMAIRGERGTEVVLTVIREGAEEPIEIPIERDEIHVPSIEHFVTESNGKNIGTVTIYQFSNDTHIEFQSALRQLSLEGIDGLIIDLRGNGGGFLEVSIEMLGELFEEEMKGVIVKRRGQEDDILYTPGDGLMPDIPLVVLINEGSASASEIMAGAIQDYERGVLMGVQSFGKGSVQELIDLDGGSSLRVTVAKWYTPEDRTIDQVGVTPDIIVEMDTVDIDTENDTQHQQAVEYLSTQ